MLSILKNKNILLDNHYATTFIVGDEYYYLSAVTNKDSYQICDFAQGYFAEPMDLYAQLFDLNLKYKFAQYAGNWVLAPDFYRLVVLDVPNIAQEDLFDALKWEGLEKLDLSEENVYLDIAYINNFNPKVLTKKAYMYSVAKEDILKWHSIFGAAEFNINKIEALEYAIARSILFSGYKDKYVALFITIFGKLNLLISKNGYLLLVRDLNFAKTKATISLNTSENETTKQQDITAENNYSSELLLHELDRSIDFCRQLIPEFALEQVLVAKDAELDNIAEVFAKNNELNIARYNDLDSQIAHLPIAQQAALVGGIVRGINEEV